LLIVLNNLIDPTHRWVTF